MASINSSSSKPRSRTQHSLRLQYLAVDQLKPDPKNARIHTDKQLRQIARSIESLGMNVPILIDSKMQVVAGHGRLAACKLLDIRKVPTISLHHLTDAQRRAFMIADNRLTENSTWDPTLLGEQLKFLAESDIDFHIEATGFEMGEIDLYIEGLSIQGGGDADPADAVPATDPNHRVSQPGDLWCLGKHRVFCGNSLEPASFPVLMGGKKADMLFADPPYNVKIDGFATGFGKTHHREFLMGAGEMSDEQFSAFLKAACRNSANHSKAGSIHFCCIDWRHMAQLLTVGAEVYTELKNLCVWAKERGGQGSLYRSQHELVFVFKHGKTPHRNNIQLGSMGRYRTNLWTYPSATSFSRTSTEGNLFALHPTVKPVALVADAILDCSARGDIVLDPFLGSGTTVIAAERTGRACYGLELDPLYIDTVVRRWQSFTGKAAVHAVSGLTFREAEEDSHAA
jgi:DNA modification methylase